MGPIRENQQMIIETISDLEDLRQDRENKMSNQSETRDIFVETAMNRLDSLYDINDSSDRRHVWSGLGRCFDDDFSLPDAVKYMSFTEHVRSELDEDYACQIMSRIGSKYPKYASRMKKKLLTDPVSEIEIADLAIATSSEESMNNIIRRMAFELGKLREKNVELQQLADELHRTVKSLCGVR